MTETFSHRAPAGRIAALGSRLGAGALILSALAVGGVVDAWQPSTDTRERPFVRVGAVGEAVSARAFDATVLGVRGGAKIAYQRRIHGTGGVWILIRIRIVTHDEPTAIGYAALRDGRGRLFLASDRVAQPIGNLAREFQPGIPVETEVAFEVPRDAFPALTVRLAPPRSSPRLDAVVEVALPGADDATVDRWLSAAEPLTLAAPMLAAS